MTDLVTKADLKAEMADLLGKLTFRILAFFIPFWIAMCGLVGTLVFRR